MRVNLTYFRDTGKFYSYGSYVTQLVPWDYEIVPLHLIWDEVRAMRDNQALPGLAPGGGYFIVYVSVPEHPYDHPRLIL